MLAPPPPHAPAGAGADASSAAELRRQLSASLGGERFEAAHARLAAAARGDGGGDDELAGGEVQRLLGERHRELLPCLLKLIFLEEATAARKPW